MVHARNKVPGLVKLFMSYPDILRFRGSVIFTILPNLTFQILLSTLVSVVYVTLGRNIGLPNSVVPSISVVVGLLLVFRNNTAYDRYYEGRRLWSTVKTNVRNLTRSIWLGVHDNTITEVEEKRQAIRYLVAFAFATKHYLRGEYGPECDQLNELLPEDFHYVTPKNSIPDFRRTATLPTLRKAGDTMKSLELGSLPSVASKHRKVDLSNPEVNLPVEISYRINQYIVKQLRTKKLDPPTFNSMNGSISALMDALGSFERILETPLPMAYSIHLKQVLFLYCSFLPFTLVKDLGYLQIAVTVIVSFMLFGIEGISLEIENPFGYDKNDLPLDEICNNLWEEMDFITKKIRQDYTIPQE